MPMLSRVADSIYWMARYTERAENLARFIDASMNLILDQPAGLKEQWEPLVKASGDEAYFWEHYGEASQESVLQFLTFDRAYANSIISCLRAARENARSVSESISSETWEQVNTAYHFVRDSAADELTAGSPLDFYSTVKQNSHLFNGILDATMSHGDGWHFANMGRLLERADKTARILDVKYFTMLPKVVDVGTAIDDLQWSSLLSSVSGFQFYRRRHRVIHVPYVIEFLLLDSSFPRAARFCIEQADTSLHAISGCPMNAYCNEAERLLGKLRSDLAYAQVQGILDQGIHQFVDELQHKLNAIGTAIHQTYCELRPLSPAGPRVSPDSPFSQSQS